MHVPQPRMKIDCQLISRPQNWFQMEDQRKPLAQHLQPLMLHLIQQLPQAAVRLNKQVGANFYICKLSKIRPTACHGMGKQGMIVIIINGFKIRIKFNFC